MALLTAALAPAAAVEYGLLVLGCGALGALSDRLATWPRALLAPAIACVAAIAADALAGSQLMMRSLLGPDPALGARFHGIGNDLKSALAVLVLAALAGGLYPSARRPPVVGARWRWRAPALACLEGAARLGAGVGGVVIVCVSFAVAVATLLPAARTRRRALIVVASPIAGLIALAAHRPRDRPRQRALLRQRAARPLRRRAARPDRPPLRGRLARAPPRGDARWPRCSRWPPGRPRCGCAHACWLPSETTRPGGRPSTGRWRPGSWGRCSRTPGRCCSSRPCSPAGACSVTCGAGQVRPHRPPRTAYGSPVVSPRRPGAFCAGAGSRPRSPARGSGRPRRCSGFCGAWSLFPVLSWRRRQTGS